MGLRVRDIGKSYGGAVALSGVSLGFCFGEVTALMGENGAGKSTLCGILAGDCVPDAGVIEFDGREVRIGSPGEARRLGIGLARQDPALVEEFSAEENLSLRLDWRMRAVRREVERLRSLEPDNPSFAAPWGRRAAELSPDERIRLEIAALRLSGARVYLLDEPTALCSPPEAERLLRSFRELASSGAAVVLVTHRLREARACADVVHVLRRGRVSGSFGDPKSVSDVDLAQCMTEFEAPLASTGCGEAIPTGETVLSLSRASGLGFRISGTAFRRGEAAMLLGLPGSGREAFLAALTGFAAFDDLSGFWLGEPLGVGSWPFCGAAMGWIPRDRRRVGSAGSLSTADNFRLAFQAARRGGVPTREEGRAVASRLIAEGWITAASPDVPVSSLSGGNLQKCILAREIDPTRRLIIAEAPAQGLDPASTQAIYSRLAAAKQHAAVLWSEDDLEVAATHGDVLHVFWAGRIVLSLDRRMINTDPESALRRVGRALVGVDSLNESGIESGRKA